jgi:hypothetical protein
MEHDVDRIDFVQLGHLVTSLRDRVIEMALMRNHWPRLGMTRSLSGLMLSCNPSRKKSLSRAVTVGPKWQSNQAAARFFSTDLQVPPRPALGGSSRQ